MLGKRVDVIGLLKTFWTACNGAYAWSLRHAAFVGAVLAVAMVGVIAVSAFDKASKEPLRLGSHGALAAQLLAPDNTPGQTVMAVGGPGYAMILAGIAAVDRDFLTVSRTSVDREQAAITLTGVQIAASIALWLIIGWISWRLSNRLDVVFLALACAAVGMKFGEMAGLSVAPYVWRPLFFGFAVCTAIEAIARKNTALWFICGACCVLLVFLQVQAFVIVPVLLWLAARSSSMGGAAWYAVGFVLVSLGAHLWLQPIYDWSAGLRQFSLELAMRTGFQQADWASFLAGVLVPTPLIGDALEAFFERDTVKNALRHAAGGLATTGVDTAFNPGRQMTAWHQAKELVSTYVLGAWPAYLLTSVGMALRGLWGNADVVGLIGVFFVGRARMFSVIDQRAHLFACLLWPAAALFIATSLSTTNDLYTTAFLGILYSVSIAYVCGRF